MSDALDPKPDDGAIAETVADDPMVLGAVDVAAVPTVAEAMTELDAARAEVAESLDELTSATQSALDIPAKIRRNPVKTAALAGGAGFLIVGGPRKMARFVVNQVRSGTRDPYDGLLPDEIEGVLKDTGVADDPKVRRALDEDFAEYLKDKGRYGPAPGPATSFWRTFDAVAGPLGTAGARIMVKRLLEAEHRRASKQRAATRDAKRAQGEAKKSAIDPPPKTG